MQQGTQNTQATPDRKQIIVIVIVIAAAAIFLLPRLFNNAATTTQTTSPSGLQQQDTTSNSNIQLGAPVSAVGVDRNGCATQTTNTFLPSDNIYVVAPNSNIPQGTNLFVRLYRNNTAIEDAPEIIADKDYSQNCINFVFQPVGANFSSGSYEAQFYVNGNAASSVTFNVQ